MLNEKNKNFYFNRKLLTGKLVHISCRGNLDAIFNNIIYMCLSIFMKYTKYTSIYIL